MRWSLRGAVALCVCSISSCWATTTNLDRASLFLLYQQYWVANPISGQNYPPMDIPSSDLYEGIPELTVDCSLWIENLEMNERDHTFRARFWWNLEYNDSRAAALIDDTPASDTCGGLCTTHSGLILNKYGDDACCDSVYFPNSFFQNLVGSPLQRQPNEWAVFAYPGSDRVTYWARGTSSLLYNWKPHAYPFDTQYLEFRILTEFLPTAQPDSLKLMNNNTVSPYIPSFYLAPNAKETFHMNGWKVKDTYVSATVFETQNGDGTVKRQPGLKYVVEVARKAGTYYAFLQIVPPLLIFAYSFFSFFLPIMEMRARMTLLGATFLSLLFCQFQVYALMPGSKVLLPPYIVLLMSYCYLMAMGFVYLITALIEGRYEMFDRKMELLYAKILLINYEKKQLDELEDDEDAEHLLHLHAKEAAAVIAKERETNDQKRKAVQEELKVMQADGWQYVQRGWFWRLCRLVLSQERTSKLALWTNCMQRSEAKVFCQAVAQKAERWTVAILLFSYLLATFLLYFIPWRRSIADAIAINDHASVNL